MDSQNTSTAELTEGVLRSKYIIGELLEGNSYNGKLLQESGVINVTVQKFKTVEEAKAYVLMLNEFSRSPYIANAITFDESNEPDELPGLAFIEPLKPFLPWMHQQKPRMWNYYHGECLGFGEDFQDVFGDIGKGMQLLHKRHYAHGSLADFGVMFDHDMKVRLVNMDPSSKHIGGSSKVKLLRDDLKDFCALIDKAVKLDPKTMRSKAKPNDLDLFEKMCRKLDETSYGDPDLFRVDVSDWIYRSFLVWKSDNVLKFVYDINKILDDNLSTLCNFLPEFEDWDQVIVKTRDVTMTHCLNYQKTDLYDKSFGLIRYTHNYGKHPNGGIKNTSYQKRTTEEAVSAVLKIFPNLIGYAYMEIFQDLRLQRVRYCDKYYTFQDYLLHHTQIFS